MEWLAWIVTQQHPPNPASSLNPKGLRPPTRRILFTGDAPSSQLGIKDDELGTGPLRYEGGPAAERCELHRKSAGNEEGPRADEDKR